MGLPNWGLRDAKCKQATIPADSGIHMLGSLIERLHELQGQWWAKWEGPQAIGKARMRMALLASANADTPPWIPTAAVLTGQDQPRKRKTPLSRHHGHRKRQRSLKE